MPIRDYETCFVNIRHVIRYFTRLAISLNFWDSLPLAPPCHPARKIDIPIAGKSIVFAPAIDCWTRRQFEHWDGERIENTENCYGSDNGLDVTECEKIYDMQMICYKPRINWVMKLTGFFVFTDAIWFLSFTSGRFNVDHSHFVFCSVERRLEA